MARVKINIYKNSALATFVSILSTIVSIVGTLVLVSSIYGFGVSVKNGITLLVIGILILGASFGGQVGASAISDRKAGIVALNSQRSFYSDWKKQLETRGTAQKIREDINYAFSFYYKNEPQEARKIILSFSPELGEKLSINEKTDQDECFSNAVFCKERIQALVERGEITTACLAASDVLNKLKSLNNSSSEVITVTHQIEEIVERILKNQKRNVEIKELEKNIREYKFHDNYRKGKTIEFNEFINDEFLRVD